MPLSLADFELRTSRLWSHSPVSLSLADFELARGDHADTRYGDHGYSLSLADFERDAGRGDVGAEGALLVLLILNRAGEACDNRGNKRFLLVLLILNM